MATLEDFLPEVAPEVHSCPEDVTMNAIRNAIRQFCVESEIWRETLDPHPVIKLWPDIDLEPPTDAIVVRVLSAEYSGRQIPAVTENEMKAIGGWRDTTGTPCRIVQESPTTVRVYPLPDTSSINLLKYIRVALQPTPTATTVPDFILNDYFEQIGQGAKSRLMLQPGKPWSNPQMAAFYEVKFQSAISVAHARAVTGFGSAPLRVKPIPFA